MRGLNQAPHRLAGRDGLRDKPVCRHHLKRGLLGTGFFQKHELLNQKAPAFAKALCTQKAPRLKNLLNDHIRLNTLVLDRRLVHPIAPGETHEAGC